MHYALVFPRPSTTILQPQLNKSILHPHMSQPLNYLQQTNCLSVAHLQIVDRPSHASFQQLPFIIADAHAHT